MFWNMQEPRPLRLCSDDYEQNSRRQHLFSTASRSGMRNSGMKAVCLRNRITFAVTLVDRDIQTRVWNEMDYRIDICRITKGGHIEHL